jgi:ParB family chromosome partitioning protein
MNPRISVPISDISVLDRQRLDNGNIVELADSLNRLGLIQPIVVNQDLRLIAGGRRLAAAKLLNWPAIDVVFRETMSEDELQELELEENVRRKDVTWQERVLAIAKIHTLKRNTEPKWGFEATGDLVNLSGVHARYCVLIGKALKTGDKDITNAAGLTDAIRILIQRKEDEVTMELAKRTAQVASPAPTFSASDPAGLITGVPRDDRTSLQRVVDESNALIPATSLIIKDDCIHWLAERFDLPTIDAIITDPPYAIDMDNLDQSGGGLTGIDRVREEHDVTQNLSLLKSFVFQAFQALKPTGFLAMWCDPMHWSRLYDDCISVGFKVQRWPVVWVKTHPCINQAAQYNFTKNIEFVLIARKPGAVLAQVAPVCHISASGVKKEDSHPFTKPPEVWAFLLKHICIQNSFIVDPFLGAGSSIEPILNAGHRFMGCEINEIHHAYAMEKFKAWHRSKNPKVTFA